MSVEIRNGARHNRNRGVVGVFLFQRGGVFRIRLHRPHALGREVGEGEIDEAALVRADIDNGAVIALRKLAEQPVGAAQRTREQQRRLTQDGTPGGIDAWRGHGIWQMNGLATSYHFPY